MYCTYCETTTRWTDFQEYDAHTRACMAADMRASVATQRALDLACEKLTEAYAVVDDLETSIRSAIAAGRTDRMRGLVETLLKEVKTTKFAQYEVQTRTIARVAHSLQQLNRMSTVIRRMRDDAHDSPSVTARALHAEVTRARTIAPNTTLEGFYAHMRSIYESSGECKYTKRQVKICDAVACHNDPLHVDCVRIISEICAAFCDWGNAEVSAAARSWIHDIQSSQAPKRARM